RASPLRKAPPGFLKKLLLLVLAQGASSSSRGAGRESVLDVGLWWLRGAQLAWR
ncbi:hypothetical protein A2U01_0112393, partial [Trifolium medium]|nr:hypothetical protein [Trifolium medium]